VEKLLEETQKRPASRVASAVASYVYSNLKRAKTEEERENLLRESIDRVIVERDRFIEDLVIYLASLLPGIPVNERADWLVNKLDDMFNVRVKKVKLGDSLESFMETGERIPTEQQRSRFEREYGGEIRRLYEKYISEVASEKGKRRDGKVVEEIEKYEKIIYSSHSHSTREYMVNLLFPFLFLMKESAISKHAVFFREKIRKGKYKVSNLHRGSTVDFFPEAFVRLIILGDMSPSSEEFRELGLLERETEKFDGYVERLMRYVIDDITDRWITVRNVTGKVKKRELKPPKDDVDWEILAFQIDRLCGIKTEEVAEIALCYDGKGFGCLSENEVKKKLELKDYN